MVDLDDDGRYLASGGNDSIVNLFDLSEWLCARTITACECVFHQVDEFGTLSNTSYIHIAMPSLD